MPFEIVRNDITKMQADAAAAVILPEIHSGADAEQFAHAYHAALESAMHTGCDAVALPLVSAAQCPLSDELALQTAVRECSTFLQEHEMHISLVVSQQQEFVLSDVLMGAVSSYLKAHYLQPNVLSGNALGCRSAEKSEPTLFSAVRNALPARKEKRKSILKAEECYCEDSVPMQCSAPPPLNDTELEHAFQHLDAGFSETLLHLIDIAGKKDSEIYKKANVDRKLFSKIRNNRNYQPSKPTALAFAFALELTLEDTRDFIARAGFALSHSSKFDVIVEYFLVNRRYNIFELNEVLFAFDQPLIGG